MCNNKCRLVLYRRIKHAIEQRINIQLIAVYIEYAKV